MTALFELGAQIALTLLGLYVKKAALTAEQNAAYLKFVEAWAPHFKGAAKQFEDYQSALAELNKGPKL